MQELYTGEVKRLMPLQKSNKDEACLRAQYSGVVYQSYYLIPELTAIENVMMSVRLSKLSMIEYEGKSDETVGGNEYGGQN